MQQVNFLRVFKKIFLGALKKLIAVSNTVNGFLANADADKKLLEMHRKLEVFFAKQIRK